MLGDPATFAVCENAGVLLASYRSEPGEVVERAQLLVLLDDGPTVEPGWLTWPAPYVSALIQLGRLDEAALRDPDLRGDGPGAWIPVPAGGPGAAPRRARHGTPRAPGGP